MAIEDVVTEAVATVQRARALFGVSAQQPPPAAGVVGGAAQTATGATELAAAMSGDLIDRHHGTAAGAAAQLAGSGQSDIALDQQVAAAATVTAEGSRRLDDIVADIHRIALHAATAHTAAGQRTVLQALQTQLRHAACLLDDTAQQSTAIAGQIRSLRYGKGNAD